MKLAISNIAWKAERDEEIYSFLAEQGIQGLEIAPTRIFPEVPYERLTEAAAFVRRIKEEYRLEIPSMQSIWFGRSENLFAGKEERESLLSYTKKAIDFAEVIGCRNLVFGCPRNRSFEGNYPGTIALEFFKELGDYAHSKGTVIAMEANPVIYNTNYINETEQAFALVKQVNSQGFFVNVDLGTIIYNEETLDVLKDNMNYVNHIHISEPGLALIEKRSLHRKLAEILRKNHYQKFVSIEMKTQDDCEKVKDVILYVKGIFGC